MRIIVLFFLISCLHLNSFSQVQTGPTCNQAVPFCTGTFTFPGATNSTFAFGVEGNSNTGCLTTTPNPSWFFLSIGQAGPIEITMNNSANLDIDFICWGPYTSPQVACATDLRSTAAVSCSYSGNAVERCNIPNAKIGEVYILLITNFSRQATNISFSQTAGTGSASCRILSANPSVCRTNSLGGLYDVSGSLIVDNPPTTGILTLRDNSGMVSTFNAPFTFPLAYNIVGIASDGLSHTVTATFSANTSLQVTQTYTAPLSCCNPQLNYLPPICTNTNFPLGRLFPGIPGKCFSGFDASKSLNPIGTRNAPYDPEINFVDWVCGATIVPGLPACDPFTVEWEGVLYTPTTGNYKFAAAYADDYIEISIDGRIVDAFNHNEFFPNGVNTLGTFRSHTGTDVYLKSGYHNFKVVHKNYGGPGQIHLGWTTPWLSQPELIKSQYIFHTENTGTNFSYSTTPSNLITGDVTNGFYFNGPLAKDGVFPITYTRTNFGCTQSDILTVKPAPVQSDIAPLVALTTPKDGAYMTGTSSTINWQYTAPYPALLDGLVNYSVIVRTYQPKVNADGFVEPDLSTQKDYTSLASATTVPALAKSVALSALGIVETNVPLPYFWQVGLKYGNSATAWSNYGNFVLDGANSSITSNLTAQVINSVYELTFSDHNVIAGNANQKKYTDVANEKVTYLDGLGMTRQVQSLVKVLNEPVANPATYTTYILGKEIAYSEEGGTAVESMVAPLATATSTTVTYDTKFSYKKEFLNVKTPLGVVLDFATQHFDRETLISGIYVPKTANTLDPLCSVAHYYSILNTKEVTVDDANGSPFAFAVAMKDPRKLTQLAGNVGDKFKVGGGKESKYFYSVPSTEELVRIYGKKVLDDRKLQNISKTVVQDNNGVMSINYADDEGKTIASAMTACNAPNLDALNEQGTQSDFSFISTYDVLKNNTLKVENLDMTSSVNFFSKCSGAANPIKLNYTLKLNRILQGDAKCSDCRFDVEVKMVEDATGLVVPGTQKTLTLGSSLATNTTTVCSTEVNTVIFDPLLDIITVPRPGTYTVYRTIRPAIDPQSKKSFIETMADTYEASIRSSTNQQSLEAQFATQYNAKNDWYLLRKMKTLSNDKKIEQAKVEVKNNECYKVKTLYSSAYFSDISSASSILVVDGNDIYGRSESNCLVVINQGNRKIISACYGGGNAITTTPSDALLTNITNPNWALSDVKLLRPGVLVGIFNNQLIMLYKSYEFSSGYAVRKINVTGFPANWLIRRVDVGYDNEIYIHSIDNANRDWQGSSNINPSTYAGFFKITIDGTGSNATALQLNIKSPPSEYGNFEVVSADRIVIGGGSAIGICTQNGITFKNCSTGLCPNRFSADKDRIYYSNVCYFASVSSVDFSDNKILFGSTVQNPTYCNSTDGLAPSVAKTVGFNSLVNFVDKDNIYFIDWNADPAQTKLRQYYKDLCSNQTNIPDPCLNRPAETTIQMPFVYDANKSSISITSPGGNLSVYSEATGINTERSKAHAYDVVAKINKSGTGYTASFSVAGSPPTYSVVIKAPIVSGAELNNQYLNYTRITENTGSGSVGTYYGQATFANGYSAPDNCISGTTSDYGLGWYIDKVTMTRDASVTNNTTLSNGLAVYYYETNTSFKSGEASRDERSLRLKKYGIETTVTNTVMKTLGTTNTLARWYGKLQVTGDQKVRFRTKSIDAVRLQLNGTTVIDDWALHAINTAGPAVSGYVSLKDGINELYLEHFCSGSVASASIILEWEINGVWASVPAANFKYTPKDYAPIILTDLDGVSLTNPSQREVYQLKPTNGLLSIDATATAAAKTLFGTQYEKQYWKKATDVQALGALGQGSFSLGSFATNNIPILKDDNTIVSGPVLDNFYLVNLNIVQDCNATCYGPEIKNPCQKMCEDGVLALETDVLETYKEISKHPYGYLYSDGSSVATLKQIADAYPTEIQLSSSDWMQQMQKAEATVEYRQLYPNVIGSNLYESWTSAKMAVDAYDVTKCVSQCMNPQTTYCDNCQVTYANTLSDAITELQDGYDYLVKIWATKLNKLGPNGEINLLDTDVFPYQAATELGIEQQSGLGELLFARVLVNIATFKTTTYAQWKANNTTGCVNCSLALREVKISNVTQLTCPAMANRLDVSRIKSMIMPALEAEALKCQDKYFVCLAELVGDPNARCAQFKADCQGTLNVNSPTYANDVLTCNDCSIASKSARERLIRNAIESVFSKPEDIDDKYLDVQKNYPSYFTPTVSFPKLEEELNKLVDAWMCERQCKSIFKLAFEQWKEEQIKTYRTQLINSFMSNCYGKLNENFKITFEESIYHYTLYKYDAAGRLLATTPPEGVDIIKRADLGNVNRVPVHRMQSTYKMNSLGQLQKSYSPDGKKVWYIYDKAGRVRFSMNEQQVEKYAKYPYSATKQWAPVTITLPSGGTQTTYNIVNLTTPLPNPKGIMISYTDYDVETGKIKSSGEMGIASNYLNYSITDLGFSPEADADLGITHGVYLSSIVDNFPVLTDVFKSPDWNVGMELTNKVYYDAVPSASVLQTPPIQQTYLEGRVVASCRETESCTYYSYDAHGRVKETYTMGFKNYGVKYSYFPVSGVVKDVTYQKGVAGEEFKQEFGYDPLGRLLFTNYYNGGLIPTRSADYRYMIHGPLRRSVLGGDVQGLDYVYNLQGWLKSINHPLTDFDPGNDAASTTIGKDVFGLAIDYFKGDYVRTGRGLDQTSILYGSENATAFNYGKDLFNGNIRGLISRTGYLQGDIMSIPELMNQRFAYDVLNRLKGSHVQVRSCSTSAQLSAAPWAATPAYATETLLAERLTYDPNGNISTLNRYDAASAETDKLAYNYSLTLTDLNQTIANLPLPKRKEDNRLDQILQTATSNPNRLVPAQTNAENYKYDAKGRIVVDLSNNITEIYWTPDDKPYVISYSAGPFKKVFYAYNSMGKKEYEAIRYNTNTGITHKTTYYAYDAAGNLLTTNEEITTNGVTSTSSREQYLYGSKRLGKFVHLHKDLYKTPLDVPNTYASLATTALTGATPVNATANTAYVVAVGTTYTGSLVLNTGNTVVVKGTWNMAAGTTFGSSTTIAIEPGGVFNLLNGATLPANVTVINRGTIASSGTLNQTGGTVYNVNTGATNSSTANIAIYNGTGGAFVNFSGAKVNFTSATASTIQAGFYQFGTLTKTNTANIAYSAGQANLIKNNTYYEISDHLGNVRAVVSGLKKMVGTKLEANVISLTDYYPFGAPMPRKKVSSTGYRFGYNGKEYDEGAMLTDYDERMYNSSIGRWQAMDPLTSKYPYMSPYVFTENKPILYVDRDGKDTWFYNADGNFLGKSIDNLFNAVTIMEEAVFNSAVKVHNLESGPITDEDIINLRLKGISYNLDDMVSFYEENGKKLAVKNTDEYNPIYPKPDKGAYSEASALLYKVPYSNVVNVDPRTVNNDGDQTKVNIRYDKFNILTVGHIHTHNKSEGPSPTRDLKIAQYSGLNAVIDPQNIFLYYSADKAEKNKGNALIMIPRNTIKTSKIQKKPSLSTSKSNKTKVTKNTGLPGGNSKMK